MQTKKRAKAVKFGKGETKKEIASKREELEEVTENVPEKIKIEEPEEEQEEVVELTPVEDNIDSVQEIKQKIEEKIHPKEEAEEKDDPEEVHLTAEEVSDSDEVDEKERDKELERKAAFGSFTNDFSEKPRTGNLRFFLGILFITFFVGLLVIEGFYFFTTNKKLSLPDSPLIAMMRPSATPTQTPTPTQKPPDLSKYSIKVLNGSGTTGEAAKVKDILTAAKFKVDTVGNADADDYAKTVIAAKKSVEKAYIDALSAVLAKTYDVETKVTSLSDSDESDVIVTIGSNTAQ